jgi:hypothetical protein
MPLSPNEHIMSSIPSFRDPGGSCFAWNKRILRAVNSEALYEIDMFMGSNIAKELCANGQLVGTRKLSLQEQEELLKDGNFKRLLGNLPAAAIFEHDKVEFASYPYEWPPEMLYAAGMLILDLAQSCLKEDFGLKDATPYNVLFQDNRALFIDLLSFERRNPHDPIWKPHAQFCRNFLLPLLAYKFWDFHPADVFTRRRDGLEPSEVYRLCSPFRRLLRPFLTQVSIPTWLGRKTAKKNLYRDHTLSNTEKAQFILNSTFGRLRHALKSVRPKLHRKTLWSDYMKFHTYPEAAFKAKEEFVRGFLYECRPGRVLDVGSNTGYFSVLASSSGARTIAIDSDPTCMGQLWQKAQSENLNMLPLVVDLSRPSAAIGWRNNECAAFLARADRAFDAVLMLAVLHHLLITERIPLDEVINLASKMTTRWLVMEFVAPQDEMLKTLTRGREHLYADLTLSAFENVCKRSFRIIRKCHLAGTYRSIYLLEKGEG